MKLHNDTDAFELLIIELSSRHNIRPDILEKDYYVTLLLKELSEKQNDGLRAFFKGGTAIYKILESLNRFSEDIDITLDNSGLNGSQSKKNLKNATKEYVSLTFSADLEINQSSRTTEFSYSSIFDVDINDRLNRFGVVKVETTDFTISKPHEIHLISPLIYTISNKSEKNILENDYDINPFEIKTISIERIFIDKLFALENRILRHEYEEASKHAYDIHHLFKLNSITSLFSNTEGLVMLINIQMDEENNRLNSNLKNIHPVNFAFHPILNREEKFIASFNVMQNIYVFNIENILEFQDLVDTIESISKAFNEMFAIENYLMIER